MKREKNLPIALTIAGSDSGGGAGIQADLKTFAALEVHGVSAITCVTAQNPRRITAFQPCRASMVRSQVLAIFEQLPPAAAKTGMLYSASIVRVLVRLFKHHHLPLVIDPVLISTSGTRMLKADAMRILTRELLPLAALITPNLHEAEALLGNPIDSPEDLRRAARELHKRFGIAALVKGGHLRQTRQAVDIFYDGRNELLLSAPFVRGFATHGTGCTYSAAITAYLARGLPLVESVVKAKEFVTQAIVHHQKAGRHGILNSFWQH